MTPQDAADQKHLDALLKKKQAGQRFSAEERAFLQRMSDKSPKGFITLGAGAAMTVRKPVGSGPLGSTPYSKSGVEANTDRGAFVRNELGVERRMPGGGTMKLRGQTATYLDPDADPRTQGDAGALYEQTLSALGDRRTTGQAALQAAAKYNPASDGGAVGLKAKAAKEFRATSNGGTVDLEAYAQIDVNKLTVPEQQALGARILMNADDAQAFDEARTENRDRLAENVDAAWRAEEARRAREADAGLEALGAEAERRAQPLRDAALDRERRRHEFEREYDRLHGRGNGGR